MKYISVMFMLLAVGCTSKYKAGDIDLPSELLSKAASAYVLFVKDGAYGRRDYRGSGRTVSRGLQGNLLRYLDRVELATTAEPREQGLVTARGMGLTYLFEAIVLNWEDRATQWSGRPDRISIRFAVFDVESGRKLAAAEEHASSKWFTFGGDHPQDLVPRLSQRFVDRLFR